MCMYIFVCWHVYYETSVLVGYAVYILYYLDTVLSCIYARDMYTTVLFVYCDMYAQPESIHYKS